VACEAGFGPAMIGLTAGISGRAETWLQLCFPQTRSRHLGTEAWEAVVVFGTTTSEGPVENLVESPHRGLFPLALIAPECGWRWQPS
jgi:hypothetical protein